MQFRQDINGLRGIAVIAVVLFHFNGAWIPGGFAGVDVFFVISGFLMTGIIFRGIEQDTFSIFRFYAARANRIIPVLSVLCITLLIFGWFYELDVTFDTISKHVLSSLIFISNITYWSESGYFAALAHEKWLLHSWSLSVEWQFYIIYPLMLVVMKKFMSFSAMKLTILIGTILAFILCVVATIKYADASYYFLPTRSWEIMMGALGYLYPITLKEQHKKVLEWVGIGLIVSSCMFISKDNPWPGYLALIPVLGTFFIIQAQRNDSAVTGNVVLQKLGTWSYSIYLWHWPFVVYMYVYLTYSFLYAVLFIGLSVVFGILSNVFIEKRFKLKYTAILWTVTTGVALLVYMSHGHFDIREKSQDAGNQFLSSYADYNMDPTGLFDQCNASWQLLHSDSPNVNEHCVSKQTGGIFLWGDSHMGALSTGLRLGLPKDIPFSQLASSGCAPSFIMKRGGIDRSDVGCDYSNDLAHDVILKNKPDVVILGTSYRHEKIDWEETIVKLNEMGVPKVIVIGPFPQWRPSLPLVYVKRHMGEEYISDPTFSYNLIESNDHMVELEKENHNFIFINMLDKLCTTDESGEIKCRAKIGDSLLTFDYGHLTVEASTYIAEHYVLPEIMK
ncbi:acyltransferase family protein [Vibrio sp. WJH972]